MTSLDTFLGQRRPSWQRLEALLEQVENSGLRSLDDSQAVEFARLYRRTASDLNQAQTFLSGEATVRYLNGLVARCYLMIHSRERVNVRGFLRTLVLGYPAVFRSCAKPLLAATAIFLAGTVFGFLASWFEPGLARELLLPDMALIQPGQEGILPSTGGLVGGSMQYFTNNTRVTLIAFALGITWGIGTTLALWFNGLMTGALAAIFVEAGDVIGFATGILPHGVLEIPAVLIGGGAGFVLAQALIRARPWPRLQELAHAGRRALWLVSGCIPLLAAAAALEAGVARAPTWFLDSGAKLAVAALFAMLFAGYLLLIGWGQTGTELAKAGQSGVTLAEFRRARLASGAGPVDRSPAGAGKR
jgi:uncharacterized membrane protein SpoIIM required for sporulation